MKERKNALYAYWSPVLVATTVEEISNMTQAEFK